MTKYKVAVKTAGTDDWTDIVLGQRVGRTAPWPTAALKASEVRGFIRQWVKTLYQIARGVEGALGESHHLPRNSAGMPDIELQLSAPGGNLAAVNISAGSASVTLYGRGQAAAYSGTVPQTRTTFKWRGTPTALHFRDELSRASHTGTQHGDMSREGKMRPRQL